MHKQALCLYQARQPADSSICIGQFWHTPGKLTSGGRNAHRHVQDESMAYLRFMTHPAGLGACVCDVCIAKSSLNSKVAGSAVDGDGLHLVVLPQHGVE